MHPFFNEINANLAGWNAARVGKRRCGAKSRRSAFRVWWYSGPAFLVIKLLSVVVWPVDAIRDSISEGFLSWVFGCSCAQCATAEPVDCSSTNQPLDRAADAKSADQLPSAETSRCSE